ncbi:MAG: prolipoprotein diacylglyceryl transferase [Bdellovibrionales bacterium]|nr:prolipoprotein diacylglyceryl transferase [Bdellovibrionales bacterium]
MYPFLFDASLGIPSYLFIISLTYCIGLLWVVKRAKKYNHSVPITLDFSLAIMIGGFIGARLFHIVFEQWDYYAADPWRVFYIWHGGFVFYGGFIGALLTSFVVFKIRKISNWGPWLDLFAPLFPFGYALGRVGCLLAGCCFGSECDLPWAISFPDGVDAPAHVPIHPTQIYATLLSLIDMTIVLTAQRKRWLPVPGQSFYLWLVLHGIGRLLVEQFRADWRGDMIVGLSVSSWISLAVLVSGIVLLARSSKNMT